MRSPRRILLAVVLAAGLVIGCGSNESDDPVEQAPASLRDQLRAATQSTAAEFPPTEGRTLQEVANSFTATGPQAALATSVFTVGPNRLAFGVIDETTGFVYAKTAVYVSYRPDEPAQGPFPAPADLLVTEPRYRSRQAASEGDIFAAIYSAQVPFKRSGEHAVLVVSKVKGQLVGAGTQVNVIAPSKDRIPGPGDPAPRVDTDTLATSSGGIEAIDTRLPPDDMHATNFKDVLGKKPIALVMATPQLCESRVCGPVVDIAQQIKAKYGDRVEFIHQEVFVDNKADGQLREPLRAFNLQTEPWLFTIRKDGTVAARLEGSFGLEAFENAVKAAL